MRYQLLSIYQKCLSCYLKLSEGIDVAFFNIRKRYRFILRLCIQLLRYNQISPSQMSCLSALSLKTGHFRNKTTLAASSKRSTTPQTKEMIRQDMFTSQSSLSHVKTRQARFIFSLNRNKTSCLSGVRMTECSTKY